MKTSLPEDYELLHTLQRLIYSRGDMGSSLYHYDLDAVEGFIERMKRIESGLWELKDFTEGKVRAWLQETQPHTVHKDFMFFTRKEEKIMTNHDFYFGKQRISVSSAYDALTVNGAWGELTGWDKSNYEFDTYWNTSLPPGTKHKNIALGGVRREVLKALHTNEIVVYNRLIIKMDVLLATGKQYIASDFDQNAIACIPFMERFLFDPEWKEFHEWFLSSDIKKPT